MLETFFLAFLLILCVYYLFVLIAQQKNIKNNCKKIRIILNKMRIFVPSKIIKKGKHEKNNLFI